MPVSIDLSGKVSIVTGSTRGIGKEIARVFGRAGGIPIINSRHQDDVRTVVRELEKENIQCWGAAADVSNSKEAETLVADVVERFGKIDILVNNAGISNTKLGSSRIEEITEEDWRAIIGTNLAGPFFMTKAALPHMKHKAGGVIINIVSEGYVYGTSSLSIAYTASKGGLVSFTRAMVRETEGYDIRVNAISPWHIRTEKVLGILAAKGIHDDFFKKNPLGKVGLPEDVAHCALFLASDYAKFIHGQVISLNGGAGKL